MYCNSFEGVVSAQDTKASGTTGTSEQTIYSYSLPANSLYKNGQALRIKALFSHAANTHGVTYKLYFGGSSISSGSSTTSGEVGELELLVIRRAAGSQLVWAKGNFATIGGIAPALTAGTDDETTALTIKATVTGGTTGADGAVESLRVEFLMNP